MARINLTQNCTLSERRGVGDFVSRELNFACYWNGNQLVIVDRKTRREIPIPTLTARRIKKLPGVESVNPSSEPGKN